MTAPTNTVLTTTLVGQREDLEDVIYRVSPEETPFSTAIGKRDVSARYVEWQTEVLATPSNTNAQLEGDDYAAEAGNNPTRVGNFCQISAKAFTISRTADVVDKAGRDTETARHKAIRGLELRRDIEARAIANVASNNEAGATPRRAGGALAWITTNDSRGAGGSDGGFGGGTVSAATNGTQRALSEALVRTVVANLFNSRGGSTSRGYQAMMSIGQKQIWSQFTGVAAIRANVSGNSMATITSAADTYVSDAGVITLIPHPYFSTRDVLVFDPDMWAMGTLDGMKTKMLGSTGDAEKYLITKEWTLISRNERASAVIADLT
jgi:hypothetical protein